LNDEVHYFDLDNVQVFGGYIQKIGDSPGVMNLEVADYSVKLGQDKFSAVYAAGMSPEAIVEDIITNYSELTYVSTIVTGITLNSKFVFKDEWVLDAVNKMLELFNGTFNVDLSKNFNMSIASSTVSSQDLMYGRDILEGGWETDIQAKAEKVIVIGAVIDQRTTETLTGTGTVFYTSYIPTNTEITGLQRTTEDISGDYVVDEENKKITFNSSKTDPVVSYTYKSQVRVELGTGKTVMLEKKYIESKLEARKLAIEYKTRFEDGSQNSKWTKVSSDIDSFVVGDMIYVLDDKNSKTGYYLVRNVTLELPKKMTLEIGEGEEDLFDWQKETIERIKQLEKNNTNSDFITLYDFLNSKLQISVNVEFTKLEAVLDTGVVLFASDTTLSSDADLISDTGIDADYALAYDDGSVPAGEFVDYLA
jgi:hypothetical protein